MLERVVAAVCVALLGWLDKRISQSATAIDADVDREHLRRAGDRIREWVQQQQEIAVIALTGRTHPRALRTTAARSTNPRGSSRCSRSESIRP